MSNPLEDFNMHEHVCMNKSWIFWDFSYWARFYNGCVFMQYWFPGQKMKYCISVGECGNGKTSQFLFCRERLHVTYIVFSAWQQRCSQQRWISCSARAQLSICAHTQELCPREWVVRVWGWLQRECIKARMPFNWNVYEIQMTFSLSSIVSPLPFAIWEP